MFYVQKKSTIASLLVFETNLPKQRVPTNMYNLLSPKIYNITIPFPRAQNSLGFRFGVLAQSMSSRPMAQIVR